MHERLRSGSLGAVPCLLLICASAVAGVAAPGSDPAATLRQRHVSMQEQLRTNQFGRPLVLDSIETADRLQGDIYAIVDYPLDKVSAGLASPDHWCDVMLLHINTKYCHAMAGPSGTVLRVNVGGKKQEALADSGRIEFRFSAAAATPDYFATALDAENGPLGTSDYRVRLEAVALPNARTFVHLTYSYTINLAARLAMKTYLGTVGNDKVGFTLSSTQVGGQASHIGGVRGLVERNTMRYYLAIDSFLGATDAVAAVRLEHRLQSWFTAVERYPRQLHEMDRAEYLEMKRAEHLRQQTER
ncbi:MAG: hypothetical protein A2045_15255 [Rhodocyclales bacterium GWA2_65_20]|nr:MAG: hypothetical protein A2045_15255 [Rhodocyclales bacterium GWA2_65_20]